MNYNEEFNYILKDILKNEKVQEMKKFRQHFLSTTYNHSYEVAIYCYKICKKFRWDYKSATRAAMLHDLFLYDCHKKEDRTNKWHAFTHGNIACKNADALFKLNEKEKNMIKNHMWPLTLMPPTSKEGMVLTFVDKYCASKEGLTYFFRKLKNNKIWQYASLFYLFLIKKF